MKKLIHSRYLRLLAIALLTACSSPGRTCVFPGLNSGAQYGYSYRYDGNFYAGSITPDDSGEAEVTNVPSDFPCDQVSVESLVVN